MTVSALATLRNKVGDAETSSFGGVVFARADNEKIQSIDDLTNRVVIASSVYEMGSGPMQWEEMRIAGQDLLFAPSQATTRSYYMFPLFLRVLLSPDLANICFSSSAHGHLPFPALIMRCGREQVIFTMTGMSDVVQQVFAGKADVGCDPAASHPCCQYLISRLFCSLSSVPSRSNECERLSRQRLCSNRFSSLYSPFVSMDGVRPNPPREPCACLSDNGPGDLLHPACGMIIPSMWYDYTENVE
jgi:hypothetical protein